MPSFFETIYELVRLIPKGRVATYGQIATYLGHARGARTVGWALHGLPGDSDVPWHRVVGAGGALSTNRLPGGGQTQRSLLEGEGVEFGPDGRIEMSVYGWGGPAWDQLDQLMPQGRRQPYGTA